MQGSAVYTPTTRTIPARSIGRGRSETSVAPRYEAFRHGSDRVARTSCRASPTAVHSRGLNRVQNQAKWHPQHALPVHCLSCGKLQITESGASAGSPCFCLLPCSTAEPAGRRTFPSLRQRPPTAPVCKRILAPTPAGASLPGQ